MSESGLGAERLASPSTWPTVKSDASRSCIRLHESAEYPTALVKTRIASRIALYQRVRRVRMASGATPRQASARMV